MKVVAIIPARYGSTRFPGKPLAMIGDKPMIQYVYERVAEVTIFDEVWVATDDDRILNAVAAFGGLAAMTSPDNKCGTDRCAELASELHLHSNDVIINIQGDMPMIKPKSIWQLVDALRLRSDLATLITECAKDDLVNPHCVKVVEYINLQYAFKFSRKKIYGHTNFKHIGAYGYTMAMLQAIQHLSPPTSTSNLEQTGWMRAGFAIYCAEVEDNGISVDTPEDLERVKQILGV